MVDILALAISHGLLLIAAWRLLSRPDLDVEGPDAAQRARRGGGAAMRPPLDRDAQGAPDA